MPKYRVLVTNPTVTSGVGPTLITAPTPDEAKRDFAHGEQTTVAQMEANGLTWWSIEAQEQA